MLNSKRYLSFFLIVLVLTFAIPLSVSFSKTKAEIQYELEEAYINNRIDLDWGEKVKARLEAYDRIFGKEDEDTTICWVICIGLILVIVVAVVADKDKQKAKKRADKIQRDYLEDIGDTKECPYCFEILDKETAVCTHCKRELD